MKLVIDLPEETYKEIKEIDMAKVVWMSQELHAIYNGKPVKETPTVDAIVIPENATNGDMIKAVFLDIKWFLNEDNEVFTDHKTVNQKFVRFNISWWNAPYKRRKNEISN